MTEFAHLRLGAERDDPELLDRPVETLEAVVTKSGTAASVCSIIDALNCSVMR